ncbi:MAG: ribbon-helix-helix protein, CopG family [Oscillospiraceae bacterium]
MEKEQTTIRLPAELKAALEEEAARRGDSFNGLLMILINAGWKLMRQGQL